MRKHRARKSGFTIVELLVVIGIIAILAALIIPAVSMARAASRRATCSNHLRQIGIALHAYEASEGSFPTATGGISGGYRSFLVALLPHVERRPLYDSINFGFDLARATPENLTAISTRVGLWECPADGLDRGDSLAATNYAGNQGGGTQRYGLNGVFQSLDPVRPGDIRDGTSNTAAVSEWATGPLAAADRHPLRSVFRTPNRLLEPDEMDRFAAECLSIDVDEAPVDYHPKGDNWFFGDFGYTLYNHLLPPNAKSCLNGGAYQHGAWTAGSFHPGGVNVLHADGHVDFVRRTIDLGPWRALASRNGGELASTR